jgi:prepilin-type processing-associated H-X9-DG protein
MPMARIGRKSLNDPWSEPYDFYSPHGLFVNFLFCDGSVRPVMTSVDIKAFKTLATRAGGDDVPLE